MKTCIAVVSDLHLSEGRSPRSQRISRLETFLADRPFAHFLGHLEARAEASGEPWTLVVNGDMMDFLRVTSIPDQERPPKGLPHLSATKKSYGLGTSPAESKWQLERIIEGHPVFFRALARFLLAGNEVVIIKGNHDVNWFWPEVRYRFLELLERHLLEGTDADEQEGTQRVSEALDRLQIRAWSFLVEGLLYVEHGNQYDAANTFRNFLYPLLVHPTSPVDRYELDLPFGSFFVRYFFNKVQLQNPLAPNFRHASTYFLTLWRRHFYETWNIVRNYFPYFFRTLGKIQEREGPKHREIRGHNLRLIREAGREYEREKEFESIAALQEPPFEKKLDFFMSVFQSPFRKIGIAFGGIFLFSFTWSLLSEWILGSHLSLLLRTTFSLILNYAFILLGLLLVLFTLKPSRSGASYREAEPETLRKKAARIAEILGVKYVVFGHTHFEDIWQVPDRDAWYLNTGTWVPMIDEETQKTRPESHFPVVILEGERAGLMRWNDSSRELEEYPLLDDRPRD